MFPSFLLSLREGLEAALILGIIIGVLDQLHKPEIKPVVWRGVLLALGLSIAIGIGLNTLGMELSGKSEEVFEGFAMILAAAVLTWMIIWMQRQGRQIQLDLESKTAQATIQGGASALFLLAFVAVFREGIELALFLLAARMSSNPLSILVGTILGLGGAITLGWMLFSGTRKLNLKHFFQVTNVLLLFFAAGLVALGVHELNEAGWIPGIIEPVWDINHILSDSSVIGGLLKVLFGYNGDPSMTEVLAYVGYFLVVGSVLRKGQRDQVNTEPAAV